MFRSRLGMSAHETARSSSRAAMMKDQERKSDRLVMPAF